MNVKRKRVHGGQLPPKRRSVFFVLQQGGSTCEWYAGVYDTFEEAKEQIRRHAEASYTAIGPFKLQMPSSARLRADICALLETAVETAVYVA